jgi:hypothetical protein
MVLDSKLFFIDVFKFKQLLWRLSGI